MRWYIVYHGLSYDLAGPFDSIREVADFRDAQGISLERSKAFPVDEKTGELLNR